MDTPNTEYTKGKGGHRARTTFVMEQAKDSMGRIGVRVLEVTTYKYQGGLGTFASVHIETTDNGIGITSFTIGRDYHKRVMHTEGARCTDKSVRDQHEACICPTSWENIVARAREHYDAEAAAKALHARRDAELARQDQQQAA